MRWITSLTLLGASALAFADSIAKSLYDRIGGIHKVAAILDAGIDMEAQDELLLSNPRFKMALESTPRPLIKFMATSYVANMVGGPQKSYFDLPGFTKWFEFTPEQEERAWELRWKGFEKAGVSKDLFMEVRKMFEERQMKAKPMAAMPEMFKDSTSLYARLGGIAPISLVVNDFVDLLATDPTIGANPNTVKSLTSGKVSGAGLKYLVTEQLGQAAGGPQKYTGKTMKDSHKGLMISAKEWESAGMLLKKVLDKYNVPAREQGEIFTVITSTRGDIVGK